jgi:hypothetical protein
MWTRVKRSGTEQFPQPRDLIAGFLKRLVDGRHIGGWAHFELEKRVVWLDRLFAGIEQFVEVAYDGDHFKLNKEKVDYPVPSTWRSEKRLIIVPIDEQEQLIEWIDGYFKQLLAQSPRYTVKGWLDGL